MLYFGSFNPIHNGHISLAEYVVEMGLCDELIMVVSPQNPLKSSVGLIPELERFNIAEIAAAASKYPEQIKPSVIEFMLPKPSYTINTLRHLTAEYGHLMQFSVLVGGDIVEQLEQWREYEAILLNYPLYVYPRKGERVERHLDQITLLENAPYFDVSSTEIRERIRFGESVNELLPREVSDYIKKMGFWSDDSDTHIAKELINRGRYHYQREAWGDALNSFNRALKIEPNNTEVQQLIEMTQQILAYRYTDIYNP